MFDKLKQLMLPSEGPNEVEFYVEQEDFGVIPYPFPAKKFLPGWYKDLAPHINNEQKLMGDDRGSTIKRCPPFLDAMCAGWIIPLAADVEFISNDGADNIQYKSMFYKPMIQNHGMAQVAGNPHGSKPPMKFLNYIYIVIPEGYCALFMPPLNRPDARFQCVAGQVDSGYMGQGNLEYINFPFFFLQPKYTGIVRAGTPLVQMLVYKQDQIYQQADENVTVYPISNSDKEVVERTRRRRASHESFYRDKIWHRKSK